MLLVLVRPHYALDSRSALKSNLVLFFLLKHKVMHALFAKLSDLSVFIVSNLLDLVFAALLQLKHVGSHAESVLISLEILEPLLL